MPIGRQGVSKAMDKTAFLRLFLAFCTVPLLPGCVGSGPVVRPGEKPVMIYDTATGRIVGDEIYNLREP